MKRIFNLMMFACIMVMAACSSDVDDIISDNNGESLLGEEITIGVGMPENDETRVSIDDRFLNWETGDVILAIAQDGNGQYQTSEFTLVSGEGTKNAVFKGMTISGATSYSFVYKSSRLRVNGGTHSIDYSNLTQDKPGNQSNVRECLHIFADNVLKENLKNNILMKNTTSFLALDVNSLPYNVRAFKEVKWLVNYGKTNNLNGSLKFLGAITHGSSNLFYIPFETATELDKGANIAFQFIEDKKTLTVIGVSTNGKTYLEGKKYSVKVSTDKKAKGVLNDWLLPMDNEIWVKTNTGRAPKNIMIGGLDIKANTELNVDGWYVYESANTITSAELGAAFKDNLDVTDVWLPQTVKEIPNDAFNGCTSLKEVIFADDITKIGDFSFMNCNAMTEFVIPASVNSIGYQFIDGTGVVKLTMYPKKSDGLLNSLKEAPKVFLFKNAKQCDFYIDNSWKKNVDGNVWSPVKIFSLGLFSVTFKSITLIDEFGNVVK